jgi:tight adherence protein B
MSRAAAAAGLAGALGVLGLWEALAAAEAAAPAWLGALARPLLRAGREGREPTPPERRRLALTAALTLLVAGWVVAGPVAGVALAAAGPVLAVRAVRARRRRWRAALAREAPGAARALADALGAGHSVRGAIAEAARGLPGAAGRELGAAARALALGARTEEALVALRERAGGGPWETIVAAVLLQREAGGDLAGLLRGLAATQEEALRLARDARAATAQARLTGLLVCGLPLGAAALTELAAPGTVGHLLAVPASAILAGLALVLQAASLVAIRRLARVPA